MSMDRDMFGDGFLNVLLIIGLFVGAYLIYRIIKQGKSDINIDDIGEKIELNEINLEVIIDWFNQDEVKKLLSEDQNNKAILLKPGKSFKVDDKKNVAIQCVFNSKNNKIIKGRAITYQHMNEELEKMFGEKDMIFFQ